MPESAKKKRSAKLIHRAALKTLVRSIHPECRLTRRYFEWLCERVDLIVRADMQLPRNMKTTTNWIVPSNITRARSLRSSNLEQPKGDK